MEKMAKTSLSPYVLRGREYMQPGAETSLADFGVLTRRSVTLGQGLECLTGRAPVNPGCYA